LFRKLKASTTVIFPTDRHESSNQTEPTALAVPCFWFLFGAIRRKPKQTAGGFEEEEGSQKYFPQINSMVIQKTKTFIHQS